MSSPNVPEGSHRPDDNLELGRRLVAALLSYHYGLASVDYTLKRYIPQAPHPSWDALAHDLLHGMIMQVQGEIIKRLRN
jgi:hypothetical protein